MLPSTFNNNNNSNNNSARYNSAQTTGSRAINGELQKMGLTLTLTLIHPASKWTHWAPFLSVERCHLRLGGSGDDSSGQTRMASNFEV